MKKILVPILKQTKDACGPTCLRMVLKYFGDDKSLREIITGVGGIKKDLMQEQGCTLLLLFSQSVI